MPKESDWYSPLVDVAHQFGWLVHHSRPARMQSGKWATPIMGDKGYVDFTFVHPREGIVAFREVKGPRTTVEPMQKIWMAAIAKADGDVDIWRMPKDWERAVAFLSFGRGHVQVPML